MAYTLRNLKDLDDAAVGFGLSPDVEARFARTPLEATKLGLSYQRLQPNVRVPFAHRHETQEEVYVVISGSAHVKLDDDVIELKQWDALRVDPRTMRAFEAGPDGLEFLAIGAPVVEGGDAEMVKDWWA
jgi:mannose-6-phosphate isomerase-like protein (cupin superfamily)